MPDPFALRIRTLSSRGIKFQRHRQKQYMIVSHEQISMQLFHFGYTIVRLDYRDNRIIRSMQIIAAIIELTKARKYQHSF